MTNWRYQLLYQIYNYNTEKKITQEQHKSIPEGSPIWEIGNQQKYIDFSFFRIIFRIEANLPIQKLSRQCQLWPMNWKQDIKNIRNFYFKLMYVCKTVVLSMAFKPYLNKICIIFKKCIRLMIL